MSVAVEWNEVASSLFLYFSKVTFVPVGKEAMSVEPMPLLWSNIKCTPSCMAVACQDGGILL